MQVITKTHEKSGPNAALRDSTGEKIGKRLKRDTLSYLSAKFLPAVLNVFVLPIYTRIFSPHEYGTYVLVIAGTTLCAEVCSEWLRASILRFHVKYQKEGRLNELYSTVFSSLMASLILLALCGYLVLTLLQQKMDSDVLSLAQIGILVFVVISVFNVFVSVLRASLRSVHFSIVYVLFSAGKIVMALGLIFLFESGIDGILWGTVLAGIACVLLLFLFLPDLRPFRPGRFSSQYLRKALLYGYPFSIYMLASWSFTFSDRYLIGFLRNNEEVGLYSVSFTISQQSLTLIFSAIMLAAYPLIVESWEHQGREAARQLISDATRLYFLLCIPLVAGLSLMSKGILHIFVGNEYWPGHSVLPLIALSTFFFGLSQYVNKAFELSKRSHFIAIIILAAVVINIGLNCFLIPHYGFVGAGVASAFSTLALFIISQKISRHYLRWSPPSRSLKNVLIATLGMTMIVILLKQLISFNRASTLTIIFVAVCSYVAGLILLGEISVRSMYNTLSLRFWREA